MKNNVMRTFSLMNVRMNSANCAWRLGKFNAGIGFPMRQPARLERAAAVLGVRLLRLLIVVILLFVFIFLETLAQREQRLLLQSRHRTNGVLDELDGLLWRYANLAAQVLLKFDAVRVQGFTAHRDSEGFHRSISLYRTQKKEPLQPVEQGIAIFEGPEPIPQRIELRLCGTIGNQQVESDVTDVAPPTLFKVAAIGFVVEVFGQVSTERDVLV